MAAMGSSRQWRPAAGGEQYQNLLEGSKPSTTLSVLPTQGVQGGPYRGPAGSHYAGLDVQHYRPPFDTTRMTPVTPPRIQDNSSTANGVLIGLLSSFGSAILIALIFTIIYFFKYTHGGRILLDRLGAPGEFDDEQAFAREEEEALETMDEGQRSEYLRAKSFIEANPPDSAATDISLSQYLAIQEKGVSAWEFEPELEIASCFVEARTEIEFFDTECCVLSNLPVPKQNEVYYWESKIYDKPEQTTISIGMATKPYPLFRLPGYHKYSVAYTSNGQRRLNQPFPNGGTPYGPAIVQGDVIGCGYRPRTGTIFYTRNGKRLEDIPCNLKTQNLFPAVGANGPCTVHVNFGQAAFVFIEANVKKWGLAPMTGSLAPPPPYGSEQGSILLETGREGIVEGARQYFNGRHGRGRSAQFVRGYPTSPGPVRSPTDISLAHLVHVASHEDDGGVGSSGTHGSVRHDGQPGHPQGLGLNYHAGDNGLVPPPEYSSPPRSRRGSDSSDGTVRGGNENRPLMSRGNSGQGRTGSRSPPIPSYLDAVRQGMGARTDSSSGERNRSGTV